MNPQYVPRDYQDRAIAAVFAEFERVNSTLLVLATGTGKTELYLQVAERFLGEHDGRRGLVIGHRDELITQPARRWRRNSGEWPAVEMGELRSDVSEDSDLFDAAPLNDRLVIASIQTLNSGRRCTHCAADCQACNAVGKVTVHCSRCSDPGNAACDECKGTGESRRRCKSCGGDGWVCTVAECQRCFEHFVRRMQKFRPEDFGLVIIDEGHHAVADSYRRVIRYFRQRNPGLKVLLLTATPDRADEEALARVAESVAYEYSLPQPILDGWLTPIDQQFIVVEDLNLARVRTTAGDLNESDLEAEMMAERVLHKVTTPLVEIGCGLEPGTVDRLIVQNRLDTLESLCNRREPTLVHAASVAHAERMTEIINRYLPGSAQCIVGATSKADRRAGLQRFAAGEHQFLLSCGVFLEGVDLPNVSIIGMARPTKSRSLYSQMLGRGLRPLSGLVDGVASAEERCQLIRNSAKPRCLVIDFAGNSGRHKLVSAAEILGDAAPDDLVADVVRKAVTGGQPVDILRALQQAKQEQERQKREQARHDAAKRLEQEDRLRKQAAERRQGIVAGVTYSTSQVNPFDVMDLAPGREPGWHKGKMPTEGMKAFLTKAKVPFSPQTTYWEAHLLIEEVLRRRRLGLCTFSQAKLLTQHGYPADTPFKDASPLIDAIRANGWRRPAEAGQVRVSEGTTPGRRLRA